MDTSLQLQMLERELHGIDCELSAYRVRHQVDTQTIARLEVERIEVVAAINRLRYPTLAAQD